MRKSNRPFLEGIGNIVAEMQKREPAPKARLFPLIKLGFTELFELGFGKRSRNYLKNIHGLDVNAAA